MINLKESIIDKVYLPNDLTEPVSSKLFLLIQLLLLNTCLAYLIFNPATNYQSGVFWPLATGIKLVFVFSTISSVFICFSTSDFVTRIHSIISILFVFICVLSIPIIRNYYFLGSGDSLSNLARGKSLLAGDWSYFHQDFLHPGIDGFAVILTSITQMGLNKSYYLVVIIFGGLYILFSTMIGIKFMNSNRKIEIAIFTSLLFAPINHMGTYLLPRASSMGVLFSPFIIYLFLFLLKHNKRGRPVLIIALLSLNLIHPRIFISILSIFALISLVIYRERSKISSLRISGIVAIVFYLWIVPKNAFQYFSTKSIVLIYQFIMEGGIQGTEQISQATSGAHQGIVVILEFFVKNFLPGMIILSFGVIIAFITLYRDIMGRNSIKKCSDGLRYFSYLFMSLGGISVIWFINGVAWVRFHGLIMAVGIPLGAIAIDRYYSRTTYQRIKPALSVFFAVLLLLSIFSMHTSPYLFKGPEHVTEASVEAYATMISYESSETKMVSLRKKTRRYRHLYNGVIEDGEFQKRGPSNMIPRHLANRSLKHHYSKSLLLPSTKADRFELIKVKDGYRLNRSDVRYLEVNYNRVYTNKDTKFYYINISE